jgi:hypothetical protein
MCWNVYWDKKRVVVAIIPLFPATCLFYSFFCAPVVWHIQITLTECKEPRAIEMIPLGQITKMPLAPFGFFWLTPHTHPLTAWSHFYIAPVTDTNHSIWMEMNKFVVVLPVELIRNGWTDSTWEIQRLRGRRPNGNRVTPGSGSRSGGNCWRVGACCSRNSKGCRSSRRKPIRKGCSSLRLSNRPLLRSRPTRGSSQTGTGNIDVCCKGRRLGPPGQWPTARQSFLFKQICKFWQFDQF